MITPIVLTSVLNLVLSKYTTPIWGVVSGYLMYRLKAHGTKRDDFTVIKDSLYQELDRVRVDTSSIQKTLGDSKAENEKCEARFFELSTQHKELLKHCIFLTREVKVLKTEMAAQKEAKNININVGQTTINPEATGATDSKPGEGRNP